MSEHISEKAESPEQISEILLVLDKEKMKIQAVKSIDKSGKMETVDPTKKNQSEFMRVDKHGDFVTNFLSNFWRQLKDPTKFALFKVSADEAVEKAKEFQNQINNPTAEGKKKMEKHEVKNEPEQEQKQENKNDMTKTETTPETSEYRFQPEQIDWETMNNLGLSKEYLEKKNLLDPLLRGYKTNELVPISVNLGGAVVRTDARLSLQSTPEGDVVAAVHGIRREPNLNFEFFGHKFSDEDKQNLRQTGNMGRVVDLINSKTGELMPSIISVDRLTNELIALKTEENIDDKGYIARPTDQRLKFGILFQDYIEKIPNLKLHLNLVYNTGLPGGSPSYADPYLYQNRLRDYRRADVGFSKVLIDNYSNSNKKNWLGNFKELAIGAEIFNLFNNQNAITNTWVRDVYSKNQYAIPNYMTTRVFNIKLTAKL